MTRRAVLLAWIGLLLSVVPTTSDEVKVGVLLPNSNEAAGQRAIDQSKAALDVASSEISASTTLLPGKTFSLRTMIANNTKQLMDRAVELLQDPELYSYIGVYKSFYTEAVHALFRYSLYPQVAFESRGVTLDDRSKFGFLMRVAPSDRLWCRAAVALLEHYKWRFVSTVATLDTSGDNTETAGAAAIRTEAAAAKYDLKGSSLTVKLGASDAEIDAKLNALKFAGDSVFLVWVRASDFTNLLLRANNIGLTGPAGEGSAQYTWIAYLEDMQQQLTDDPDPSGKGVRYAMQGMFGLAPQRPPEFEAWKAKKMSKYSFDTMTPAFAYDSVYALAHAMTELYKNGDSPADGTKFMNGLLKTSFTGASGKITLLNGERQMVYDVLNVNGGKLNIVGNWTPATLGAQVLKIDSSLVYFADSTSNIPAGSTTAMEIGVILPKMSEVAPHVAAIKKSAEAVSDSLTLLPGRRFVLRPVEYSTFEEMLTGANRLLARPLLAGVIGSYWTSDSRSVHLLARGQKKPMLSFHAISTELSTIVTYPNFMRVCSSSLELATAAASAKVLPVVLGGCLRKMGCLNASLRCKASAD
jgi:hypothetical protein